MKERRSIDHATTLAHHTPGSRPPVTFTLRLNCLCHAAANVEVNVYSADTPARFHAGTCPCFGYANACRVACTPGNARVSVGNGQSVTEVFPTSAAQVLIGNAIDAFGTAA